MTICSLNFRYGSNSNIVSRKNGNPDIYYRELRIFNHISKSNLSYNLKFLESSESSSSDDNSSSDNSSDDDSDNDSEANEKTPAKNPDLKDLGLDWGSDDSS